MNKDIFSRNLLIFFKVQIFTKDLFQPNKLNHFLTVKFFKC